MNQSIEEQKICNSISWSDIEGCKYDFVGRSEPLRVIRQYVNSAVFVESSVRDMAPFKKTACHLNYSSDDEVYTKIVKVKRCVCLTLPNECPCHPLNYELKRNGEVNSRDELRCSKGCSELNQICELNQSYDLRRNCDTKRSYDTKQNYDTKHSFEYNPSIELNKSQESNKNIECSQNGMQRQAYEPNRTEPMQNGESGFGSRSNTFRESAESGSEVSLKSNETGSTIKPAANYNSEFRLSIHSAVPSSCYIGSVDDQQREEAYRRWFAKKARERKRLEEERMKQKETQEKEKQRLLEIERENFKRWLSNKKKEEEKRRREEEKKLEEEKLRLEMKEKRMLENELSYQLWLKKKEEMYLEKKLKEQMKILKENEERKRRLEESLRAYNEWLKNSKNKPKPIPLNQGLQSLRSAVSVTYVNPTPWIPNIEVKPKPSSQ